MAVWLNDAVVPTMGYSALFNILGVMACISLIINYKLQYSFETFMPFVKKKESDSTANNAEVSEQMKTNEK